MTDKIRPTEAATSAPTVVSGFYDKVISHEERTWNDVFSLRADVAEYAEAGLEALAAVAISKVGLRTLTQEQKIFKTINEAESSANKVAETFGQLSLFEKRQSAGLGEFSGRDLTAFKPEQKVVDMAAYKNQFVGKAGEVVAAASLPEGYGAPFAAKGAQIIELPVAKARQGGSFLLRGNRLTSGSEALGQVIPKDYLDVTKTRAPLLNNLDGELKF